MEQEAAPRVKVTAEQSVVPPAVNVTVPPGGGPDAQVTVAARATELPDVLEVGVAVTVVVVATIGAVTVSVVVPLLPVYPATPL